MGNFIPYEKMSKRHRREINKKKRADSFGVNMTSKVIPDKTKFNRKVKHRKDWRNYD